MTLRQLLLAGAGSVALIACGDDQISGPTEGTLLVAAMTTGDDQDRNGYTFSVNNGRPDVIGLADTAYVTALEPGEYEVRLGGIEPNCAPADGTNPQAATVVAGDTVSVTFNVACEAISPPDGDGGGGGLLRLNP